jgi:hypothetical protein
MGNHAVTLRVTPLLRFECKFWLTDDGWNGSCAQPSITVQAGILVGPSAAQKKPREMGGAVGRMKLD